MAAGTMGAGAIASFLLAGAWFRYDLLWVIVLMLPVFVVSADSASRIGALNPDRGLFTLVRERMSPALAWLILAVVLPLLTLPQSHSTPPFPLLSLPLSLPQLRL